MPLTYLDLHGSEDITDKALIRYLSRLPLEHLSLNNCLKITDAALAFLPTSLRYLDLSTGCSSKITDVGLSHLARLLKLNHLEMLNSVRITNDGLNHLSSLPLFYINLEGCEQIKKVGLDTLPRSAKVELSFCYKYSKGEIKPFDPLFWGSAALHSGIKRARVVSDSSEPASDSESSDSSSVENEVSQAEKRYRKSLDE